MKMNKEKLDAFCEMMTKELNKIDCRASFGTDSEYCRTDIVVEHRNCIDTQKYAIFWKEVHSLTEAAVPILVDIRTRLNSTVDNRMYENLKNENEMLKNIYYGLSLTIKDVIFNPHAKRTKIDTKIVFEDRINALVALSNLKDIFDRYGVVSVGDLYDEAAIKCDYTHSRFGWKDHDAIHNAKIVKVKGGYMIDLPEPVEFE